MLSLRPIFKAEEAKIDTKKQLPFQRDQMGKICEILGPVKRMSLFLLCLSFFPLRLSSPSSVTHTVFALASPFNICLPSLGLPLLLDVPSGIELTHSGSMARNSAYARIQNIPPNRSIPNHKPFTNMVLYPIKFSARLRFIM